VDWLHNNDHYASATVLLFSELGMLNWLISTVRKGSVLVRVHMEALWVLNFWNVVPH